MKSFQDLMGYQPGINEVLVTKRQSNRIQRHRENKWARRKIPSTFKETL